MTAPTKPAEQSAPGSPGMVDDADLRRLALSLPGVVEIDSDGFDFRVANRGFVWSYPERVPGHGWVIRIDIAVLYVGDEAEKQALLLGEPELFFMVPEWDRHPVVLVRLARLDVLASSSWSPTPGGCGRRPSWPTACRPSE